VTVLRPYRRGDSHAALLWGQHFEHLASQFIAPKAGHEIDALDVGQFFEFEQQFLRHLDPFLAAIGAGFAHPFHLPDCRRITLLTQQHQSGRKMLKTRRSARSAPRNVRRVMPPQTRYVDVQTTKDTPAQYLTWVHQA